MKSVIQGSDCDLDSESLVGDSPSHSSPGVLDKAAGAEPGLSYRVNSDSGLMSDPLHILPQAIKSTSDTSR